MKRFIKIITLPICFLLGSFSSSNAFSQSPAPPDEVEVVWRAVLLALEERGLSAMAASKDEGRIVSGFGPLDAQAVPKMTSLADQDHDRKWAGGEYRYVIDIGRRAAGRGGILVRTEIKAWEQEKLESPSASAAKRVLKSNNTLERKFLQILSSTLARADAELTDPLSHYGRNDQ
jgi:hypothetical protein